MPELPEVETVRRVLESWCKNKIVKKVYVYYSPIVNNCDEKILNEKLTNQKVLDIERLGKFLIFRFNNFTMLSHLRMEGKWHYGHFSNNEDIKEGISFDPLDRVSKASKHVHFAIEFSDGYLLMYHDVRKFGRIELFDNDECYYKEPLIRLGYEPFNANMNPSYLLGKFRKLKCSIKEALLDQSIMVGLGNIYCDEVLFACNILPSTKAKTIDEKQASNLINQSTNILLKAIELGGSTIKSYHAANSVDGKFQNLLQVYGRDKQKCVKCNSLIFKAKLGGRGTHFCPKCQKSNLKNRVIGITGLIGSGKSSASNILLDYGYILLDADKITKNAQLKDQELYKKIIKLFKNYNILDDNKELNRSLIRNIIIENNDLNVKLKKIVHEYVYHYIFEEIFKNPDNKYVLDIPLLFESHIDEICDKIIVIECEEEVLLNRIINRNTMSIENAKEFMELQKNKLQMSKVDYIIENNGSILELKKSILKVINTFNN